MDIISVSPLFFLLTANLEGWCWWHCNAHMKAGQSREKSRRPSASEKRHE